MLKNGIIFIIFVFVVILLLILTAITQNTFFIGLIALILGILILYFSIVLNKKEDYSKWSEGKGKIINISTSKYDHYSKEYTMSNPYIIVEFFDEFGNKHKGKSQYFKKVNEIYKCNDEVKFKYKLSKNSIFGTESLAIIRIFDSKLEEVDGKKSVIILGIIGVILIILSIYIFTGKVIL